MKYILLVIIGLLITTKVQSQELGLAVGGNYSTVKSAGGEKDDYMFGVHFGPSVFYPISDKLGIKGAVLFNQKGMVINDFPKIPGTDPTVDEIRRRLNYISVPVCLHYIPVKRFHLIVGVESSYLLSARENSDVSDAEDIKWLYSNFDFGVIGGLGFRLLDKWMLTSKYVCGLTNLYGKSPISITNRTFSISVEYKIL